MRDVCGMSRTLLVALSLAVLLPLGHCATYSVTATRLNRERPLLDHEKGESVFQYNYNPAVFQWPVRFSASLGEHDSLATSLLVRVQNNNSAVTHDPYSVTPSFLALSKLVKYSALGALVQVSPITDTSVSFKPTGPTENYGTEDPRIAYNPWDKKFYMTYSAVEQPPSGGDLICKLSLARTTFDGHWERLGPMFPASNWTKSGSLLIGDTPSGPHYLFYGDSGRVAGLQAATSTDMVHWKTLDGIWLPFRKDKFDSLMVEGGPPPLRLSDGNYLYIYNSARSGFKSPKPGYDLQYNVGWLILDGSNPLKILQRSEEAILSPELSWEIGFDYLTPNVVFLEGLVKNPDPAAPPNSFLGFYGAADQVIGAVEIKVTIN